MTDIKIQPVINPEIKPDQKKIKLKQDASRTLKGQESKETEHYQQAKAEKNVQDNKNGHQLMSSLQQQGQNSHPSQRQEEYLQKVQQATNDLLAQLNIELDFKVDKKLNEIIVKVKNKETGEVIRQVPPEFMLRIAKRMEEMSGLLLDTWD